jgi:predicted ATPase
MYISSFQLNNYKSYYRAETLELSPGINIVVGQNNVGKTALLEGLGLNFPSNVHRSSRLKKRGSSRDNNLSWATVSFTISRDELWEILRDMPREFGVPLPSKEEIFLANDNAMLHENEHVMRFLDPVFSQDQFTFQVRLEALGDNKHQMQIARFPSWGQYKPGGYPDKRSFAFYSITDDDKRLLNKLQDDSPDDLDFGLSIAEVLRRRIYSFRAERFAVASYKTGNNLRLESDASNLAEVLENLQGQDPGKFSRLNSYLRDVFPQVYGISVRHDLGNALNRQIVIYDDDSLNKEDAVPLNDSGTGIGQVLAMLYVLVASEYPQTIVIDEPQSFLHPGAVRKLFEIFYAHAQHQYIIATHMPNVIAAAKPATVVLVQKERKQESKFRLIDISDTEQLRLTLHEVGARLSDVFGADYILWVEGPTERECFPLILERLRPQRLRGTEFVPVLSVDETLGKDADRVIRIYQQLSQGHGLLPPAIGFIFDRECRTDTKITDLERNVNRTVKLIPRRMFENYLLKPEAIEAVLLDAGLSKKRVSALKIEKWLNREIKKPKYYCSNLTEKEPWVKFIDGATLLDNLFTHFSDTKLSYENRKVEYGVKLTMWLLDNAPADLEEIAKLVQSLLPKDSKALR